MAKVSRQLEGQQLFGATGQGIEIARVERGVLGTAVVRDDAVADEAALSMLILPDNTVSTIVRIRFGGQVGGDSLIQFYEDSTFSDNGTPAPVLNRNRISRDLSFTTEVFGNPVETLLGTVLFDGFVAGGVKKDAVGADVIQSLQWILEPEFNYYLKVTNKAGQVEPISLEITLSEDPPATAF